MDLEQFRTKIIQEELGIDPEIYGRVFIFLDFGNINHWFENDRRTVTGAALAENEKLIVDIDQLGDFVKRISEKGFFYYGMDASKQASIHIITKARQHFKTVTKPIQWIKHYMRTPDDHQMRTVQRDAGGDFIVIPKCNFDVEICLDVFRKIGSYDTLCIFTGDNDFSALLEAARRQYKKKVILIHDQHTRRELKDKADLTITAQRIKKYIVTVKKVDRTLQPALPLA